MEDPRVHHPIINVGPVTFGPLLKAAQGTPNAKVELLHFSGSSQSEDLSHFMMETNTFMDISRLEGNGAVGRMIGSITGLTSARVPVDRIVFGSQDRKSTRLNSSHTVISYAVFCLKKKTKQKLLRNIRRC